MLTVEPLLGSGWIHEIKYDGFRTLIRIVGKDVLAFTRSGLDWSNKYQRVIDACRKLRCHLKAFRIFGILALRLANWT
jgi:ATP-dependent DNA ligase